MTQEVVTTMTKSARRASGLLVALIALCFCMVTLGGYVRLSGSGLSIPEWPLFTVADRSTATGEAVRVRSVLAPMNEAGWEKLLATLQETLPQYEGVAMVEFKRMFWIEWSHRGLASIIGLVYVTFLIVVLRSAELRGRIGKHAVSGLFLLLGQAVIGGLVVLLHLLAVKVALHLVVAFFFTSLLAWMLLRLRREADPAAKFWNPVSRWAAAVFALATTQIFSGGLMAASHAGYQINTWPKMHDAWVPRGMRVAGESLYHSFTENIVMIQFFHRWFAVALVVAVLLLIFRCMTVEVSRVARMTLRALFAIVILQVALGVLTLMTGVHTHLALAHQALGLVLLLSLLIVFYETACHRVTTEAALAERLESIGLVTAKEASHA